MAVALGKLLCRADAWVMALVYPRRTICLSCGGLSYGAPLCERCAESLAESRVEGRLCPLCGHRVYSSWCVFCRGEVPGRMRSVWRHEGVARRLVHQLKHGCIQECATILAEGMAACAGDFDLPPDTVVTWVTMPRRRRLERGIDHSRVLAEAVATRLELPCRQLLTRKDEGRTQRGLSRAERLRNLNGRFSCSDALAHPVLLVDDVLTTSATVRVCAAELLAAGATQVYIITATQASLRLFSRD